MHLQHGMKCLGIAASIDVRMCMQVYAALFMHVLQVLSSSGPSSSLWLQVPLQVLSNTRTTYLDTTEVAQGRTSRHVLSTSVLAAACTKAGCHEWCLFGV